MLRIPARYRKPLLHTCCWLLYIGYEQLSVAVVVKHYEPPAGIIYFYLVNIILFYTQWLILEKYAGIKKRAYFHAAAAMLVALIAAMLLKIAGELIIDNGVQDLTHNLIKARTMMTLDLLRSIFYMILATTCWLVTYNNRLRKTAADEQIRQLTMAGINADLKIKLSNAQNAYLQQQINPHLLFNTLNFVYSTVHRHSPDGGRAVFLLTEILDFSLRKPDENGRTGLQAEIGQISNLIDLNRYRFDFDLKLQMTVTGDPADYRIIPLVLLTLVENMFVHGDFKGKPAGIRIAVAENGSLDFKTDNFFSRNLHTHARGNGLYNIRTRLEHNYPDKFRLTTETTADHFSTHLTIQL